MKLSAKKTGAVLITVVILLVFASLAMLGVVTFLVEKLAWTNIQYLRAHTLNLAHAGIHGAIYNYRLRDLNGNGYFSLGRYNIDATNYFVLGGMAAGTAADLLMVNTANARLASGNKTVEGIQIQNATNSREIAIARMVVDWTNNSRLSRIDIGGTRVWQRNPAWPKPANADITDFTLDKTPSSYSLELRFSGAMSGATVSVQFVMTDSSARTITVYPKTDNFNFTVSATGKTTGAIIYRTIRAEYNAITGKIFNWNEINTQIMP